MKRWFIALTVALSTLGLASRAAAEYPERPITLIAPAHNEQETCVESIRSFLKLSYPELEVILVNDGSTDQTMERLRAAYASSGPTSTAPGSPSPSL